MRRFGNSLSYPLGHVRRGINPPAQNTKSAALKGAARKRTEEQAAAGRRRLPEHQNNFTTIPRKRTAGQPGTKEFMRIGVLSEIHYHILQTAMGLPLRDAPRKPQAQNTKPAKAD